MHSTGPRFLVYWRTIYSGRLSPPNLLRLFAFAALSRLCLEGHHEETDHWVELDPGVWTRTVLGILSA